MTDERRRLAVVAVVAFALGVGLAAALLPRPPARVEEREVEKIVWRDKVVEVERVVTVREKAADVVRYVDRVVTKDGEVRERVVEKTVTVEKAAEAKVELREKVVEVDKVREVERKVTLRPDWSVAVLAGAQLERPLLPIVGPLVLGVEVRRRIVGPIGVGVWASIGGAAGGLVAVEF